MLTRSIRQSDSGLEVNLTSYFFAIPVKEQRVDGSSEIEIIFVRCTLVAGKSGSWKKLSKSRLKLPQ